MWVDKSMPDNLARIRKEYEEAENKTPELQANLNQAVAAYSAVDKASKIIKGMFGNVTMMPTLMVNVSFDNDDFDLKGAIEASAKASNYGVGTVQDLDKTEREFLQDTNKIDKTNYFSPDHVYKTNIFMSLKTLQAQANEAGQKTAATIKLGNIDNEAKKFINASGLISNPDMRNTYLFAIN